MRSRRSRIAVVTANVIVSPVRSASSRARRCVSSSLMLRRIFGGPSISAEYTRAADAHQIGGAPGGLPPNAPYHASRPVSRVLYGAKQERTLRVTAIPLERRLPGVSSNLPGRPIRTSIRGFLPVPPLFGLAPGGVCRAASVAGGAVRSCRTVSPLPRDFAHGGLRFLWHFPWGHPRRTLSGTACPWSPDFPPRRPFGPCRDGRPAD